MGIFSLSSLKVCVNDTPKLNNISNFAIEYDTWRTWKNCCCCSIAAPLACALRKTGKRAVIGHNIPLRVLKTYKKAFELAFSSEFCTKCNLRRLFPLF